MGFYTVERHPGMLVLLSTGSAEDSLNMAKRSGLPREAPAGGRGQSAFKMRKYLLGAAKELVAAGRESNRLFF